MIEIAPLYHVFYLIFGQLLCLPDFNNQIGTRYNRSKSSNSKRENKEKVLCLLDREDRSYQFENEMVEKDSKMVQAF